MNDNAISTGPSSTHFSNQTTAMANSRPTPTPPANSHSRRVRPSTRVGVVPCTIMSTPNSSASRPVASFRRLSPSSRSMMRLGRPIFLATELAATASVGGASVTPV